jgi:hypothetical protein
MNKFLIKISLCILCVVSSLYGFQYVYDTSARNYVAEWPYSVLNTFYDRRYDADVLIMGNSRTGNYLSPVIDSVLQVKSLNIGFPGFPFDFDYNLMYKPYIACNVKPRLIIQDVCQWAFFGDVNSRYQIEFLPYIDLPQFRFYIESCSELSGSRWLPFKYAGHPASIGNLVKFLTVDSLHLPPLDIPYHSEGYFAGEIFHPLEHDERIMCDFLEFLGDCRRRGIEVVLICSPTHTADGCPHFDMDAFRRQIGDIASKERLQLLDYTSLFGADDSMFVDPMHLSARGRRLFSERVAHDILEMRRACQK